MPVIETIVAVATIASTLSSKFKSLAQIFRGRTQHLGVDQAYPEASRFGQQLAASLMAAYGRNVVQGQMGRKVREKVVTIMDRRTPDGLPGWPGGVRDNIYRDLTANAPAVGYNSPIMPEYDEYMETILALHALWVLTGIPIDRPEQFDVNMNDHLNGTVRAAIIELNLDPSRVFGAAPIVAGGKIAATQAGLSGLSGLLMFGLVGAAVFAVVRR